jgi:N-acetylmuramoyl-L-alanine amidase
MRNAADPARVTSRAWRHHAAVGIADGVQDFLAAER